MKKQIVWNRISELVPENSFTNKTDDPYQFYETERTLQMRLLNWCFSLNTIKTINRNESSYTLKHIYENFTYGEYITNGQMKGAMSVAGFDVADIDSNNWKFNVKTKDISVERLINDRQRDLRVGYRYDMARLRNPQFMTEEEIERMQIVGARMANLFNNN